MSKPTSQPAATPDALEPEKVMIEKSTLDSILARLAAVEGQNQPPLPVNNPLKKTVKVRFMDEAMTKLVVGYGKSWEKTDLGGRRYLVIEVLTKDDKGTQEKHEVESVKFMEQGVFVEAEIVNVQRDEQEKQLGYVNPTKVDYDNYRSYASDAQIPLIVKSVISTFTVRLPDGREIVVPEAGVN